MHKIRWWCFYLKFGSNRNLKVDSLGFLDIHSEEVLNALSRLVFSPSGSSYLYFFQNYWWSSCWKTGRKMLGRVSEEKHQQTSKRWPFYFYPHCSSSSQIFIEWQINFRYVLFHLFLRSDPLNRWLFTGILIHQYIKSRRWFSWLIDDKWFFHQLCFLLSFIHV